MIHPEAQKVGDYVTNFLGEGDCIAWIGSGLSLPEYLSWDDAVAELCVKCLKDPVRPSSGDAGNLMALAEECKKQNQTLYYQVLGELFGHVSRSTRSAYNYICSSRFIGFVTTNFDPLLLLAAGKRRVSSYPDLLASGLLPDSVVYLHGRAYKPDGSPDASQLVFSRGEFETAYSASFLPSFLMMILGTYNTLFVGCRLSEEYIQSTFSQIRKVYENFAQLQKRKRLILLPTEDDASRAAEEQKNMAAIGIEIVRYPRLDDSHRDVHQVLERDSHRGLDQVLERIWNNSQLAIIDQGKALPE